MNKNLKIALVSIIVVIAVVFSVNIYASVTSNVKLIEDTESLTADNFEISINDTYYAEFTKIPTLDYSFDKYLAIDLSIKNIAKNEQKFIAIKKFFLDDGTNNARHFLIDENHKKYWKTLDSEETFDITLVFAVDNATEYTLFYNKTLKNQDDKQIGFTIDGTNLDTKKVDFTTEHNEINANNKEKDNDDTNENENTTKEENNE